MSTSSTSFAATAGAVAMLVWSASPLLLIGLSVITALSGLLPVLNIIVVAALIDRVATLTTGTVVPDDLSTLLLTLGGITLAEQLLLRLRAAVERLFQSRVQNHIQLLIADHAARLDLSVFEDPAFHDQLRNASMEASYRPVAMVSQSVLAAAGLVTAVGTALVLLRWEWWIVPILALAAVALFIVSARFGAANASLVLGRTPRARKAQYLAALLTSDVAAKDVRLFGLREHFVGAYRTLLAQMYQEDCALLRRQTATSIGVEMLLAGVRPALIGFAALRAFTGAITVGQFTLYVQAIVQLHTVLYQLMHLLAQLYEHRLFVDTLFRYLALQPSIEAPRAQPAHLPPHSGQPPRIEFRNLVFRYPNQDHPVIDGVTFTIEPGETVALVGMNGAGKSTLVKLLAGLYEPSDGVILIDGVDISRLERAELRERLAVIVQDYPIYHLSLYENLALGRIKDYHERAHVIKAAEQSGLSRLIPELSNGYDTLLGRWFERGHELSGGQRQLVAITRAFVRNAPVLVLDEPSAALDVDAERHLFHQLLDARCRGTQSLLFISHRFATVRRADRIIVLEHGRVIEQGSHAQLLTHGGRYADMFHAQADLYLESAGNSTS